MPLQNSLWAWQLAEISHDRSEVCYSIATSFFTSFHSFVRFIFFSVYVSLQHTQHSAAKISADEWHTVQRATFFCLKNQSQWTSHLWVTSSCHSQFQRLLTFCPAVTSSDTEESQSVELCLLWMLFYTPYQPWCTFLNIFSVNKFFVN